MKCHKPKQTISMEASFKGEATAIKIHTTNRSSPEREVKRHCNRCCSVEILAIGSMLTGASGSLPEGNPQPTKSSSRLSSSTAAPSELEEAVRPSMAA